MVTGIDLVRCQIQVAQGLDLHGAEINLPPQERIPLYGYALQCRITTEDPANNFVPDYGKLSQAFNIPLAGGIRDPAGRRIGLQRRGDHAVLRFAAGENHRVGPRIPPRMPAHGSRPARIPRARREDQHSVPGERGQPRRLSGGTHHHSLAGRDAGAFPLRAAARPRQQAAHLPGRRDREWQPPDRGQATPGSAAHGAGSGFRRTIPRRRPTARGSFCSGSGPRAWRNGPATRSGCCSPIRPSATRTSRCWPRACAATTCSP
ncbi:hypothetical protein SBA4_480017 [Candidatus Sulfopaludibacter sp. SbA4]|nr:hypothetical protein SBA4_480017 [Candidatus Sulfopaludibacter sp. SbA4]